MTAQCPRRPFFDPFAPALASSPFAEYARLQEEAPIHWNDIMQAWVLTRYDDVQRALTSDDFEAVRTADLLAEVARRAGRDYRSLIRFLDAALFFKTGDDHLRDRRTLARIMNRVRLSTLEPKVRAMANALATALVAGGDVDAIAAFADPLPQRVMALILGLPDEDVPLLSHLLTELTLVFDPASLAVYDRVKRRAIAALDLLARRIDEARRQEPASPLATIFADAVGADDAEKLENAAATALFVYRVGAETTIGLLGSLVRMLVDHPDLRRLGQQEPAAADRFVTELLRLESNVQRVGRIARQDCTVGDVAIAKGQRLLLLIGAANRDPLVFQPPGDVATDIARPTHLAFGAGDHYCLGASLARLEARVALGVLLEHQPLARAGEEVWYTGRTVRRLVSLPVRPGA